MTSKYERVDELWFKDGSLIFEAENKIFRVSSETLTAISPIFRDMLQVPQPADADKEDGCPLVHLLNDTASEVTCFFKAIFHEG